VMPRLSFIEAIVSEAARPSRLPAGNGLRYAFNNREELAWDAVNKMESQATD
jgi:hypothetical protein